MASERTPLNVAVLATHVQPDGGGGGGGGRAHTEEPTAVDLGAPPPVVVLARSASSIAGLRQACEYFGCPDALEVRAATLQLRCADRRRQETPPRFQGFFRRTKKTVVDQVWLSYAVTFDPEEGTVLCEPYSVQLAAEDASVWGSADETIVARIESGEGAARHIEDASSANDHLFMFEVDLD